MSTTRRAIAQWQGTLLEGRGEVELASSGVGTYPITWASRAESPAGRTCPEELLGAAHASCFSMALSHALAGAGHPLERLTTTAEVDFQPGTGITEIRLTVSGFATGLSFDDFVVAAEAAKENCPVSKALAGVPITLHVVE